MAVEKFTISFEDGLAERVREVAGGNVSAWLADAAKRKLRKLETQALIADFETRNGAITEDELREVRQKWPA